MTIRRYFDAVSMDRAVLGPRRARGVDVATAADAGLPAHDDDEQLAYAAAQQRVLVTSNAEHLARLHWQDVGSGRTHAGIIVIHQQRFSVGDTIRRRLHLAAVSTPDELRGRLGHLSSPGHVP